MLRQCCAVVFSAFAIATWFTFFNWSRRCCQQVFSETEHCNLFEARLLRWSRVLEIHDSEVKYMGSWVNRKEEAWTGKGCQSHHVLLVAKMFNKLRKQSRQCRVFAGPHYCPGLLWWRRSCSLYFFQKEEQWIGTRDEHYSMVAWRSCHIQLRLGPCFLSS